MKRFLRKLLIVGGSVVVLLILTAVVAGQFLPVDKISTRVEEELEKSTGAEVTVGGAGIRWWPQLGVSLTDFQIVGTGPNLARVSGTPNELGDFSAELDRFLVQVAISPLLRKELVVDAVRMQGLDLDIIHQNESYVLKKAQLDVVDLQISMEAMGELIPEDLVLAFEGQAESLTAKGMPLKDLKFQGDLDTRILTVESMVASLGTGLLKGSLEVDYQRDPAGLLDFDFVAEKVPAEALLKPWAGALGEKLETDLDVSLRGNCTLGPEDVVRRTLMLTGQAGSAEGTLWAREWLGEIAPYLGKRQDLQDIKFRSLSHRLRMEKGNYVVESLDINGLDTVWQGSGLLGLDGSIDMDVKVKLPSGFTPELGQWSFLADAMRDESGRVNLDLHLSGMAAEPQVGLNLGSLQEAAKSDSGEALKKGLGGLLDKWKNR